MLQKTIHIFTLLLCAVLGSINAADFLREKPAVLETCQRQSTDFSKCMTKAFQNVFTSWKDGIEGYPSLKPLDPLIVPHFQVEDNANSATSIRVEINNITVTGLKDVIVKNVTFKHNSYDFKMTYAMPLVRMEGPYTGRGKVLLLKINSDGNMLMEIENGVYSMSTKVKLREQDDFKFFDLKSLQFHIESIDYLRFHFSHLFKDKALSDSTNEVFQENWKDFYVMFRPVVEQEINKVLFAHFDALFKIMPANFFIADVANEK